MDGKYLVSDTLDTRPAAQDEGVVVGDDGDDVDALCLELVEFGGVGWQVVGVAGGLYVCVIGEGMISTNA